MDWEWSLSEMHWRTPSVSLGLSFSKSPTTLFFASSRNPELAVLMRSRQKSRAIVFIDSMQIIIDNKQKKERKNFLPPFFNETQGKGSLCDDLAEG